MIRGLYTSAMGMIVQEKRQANVSQNLSNVETNSFKKQEIIAKAFDRVGVKNRGNNLQGNRLTTIGEMHLGVEIDDLYNDFQQGILEETNNSLDLAIEGEGYFTIQLQNGDFAYTRDGSFKINENGQLATKQGYLVMGRNEYNGNLESIQLTSDEIQVGTRGIISLPDGQSHTLNIVSFVDAQALQRLGENIYTMEGEQPLLGVEYSLRQGFVEKSNVNPLEEMVKMIEITRSFESNQRVVQSMDETLGKAVNEVGKL
jgi:flagellar basal-body rod protein FlgG